MKEDEIISWLKDASVMIGKINDQGEDEGKCLLNALIHILENKLDESN